MTTGAWRGSRIFQLYHVSRSWAWLVYWIPPGQPGWMAQPVAIAPLLDQQTHSLVGLVLRPKGWRMTRLSPFTMSQFWLMRHKAIYAGRCCYRWSSEIKKKSWMPLSHFFLLWMGLPKLCCWDLWLVASSAHRRGQEMCWPSVCVSVLDILDLLSPVDRHLMNCDNKFIYSFLYLHFS